MDEIKHRASVNNFKINTMTPSECQRNVFKRRRRLLLRNDTRDISTMEPSLTLRTCHDQHQESEQSASRLISDIERSGQKRINNLQQIPKELVMTTLSESRPKRRTKVTRSGESGNENSISNVIISKLRVGHSCLGFIIIASMLCLLCTCILAASATFAIQNASNSTLNSMTTTQTWATNLQQNQAASINSSAGSRFENRLVNRSSLAKPNNHAPLISNTTSVQYESPPTAPKISRPPNSIKNDKPSILNIPNGPILTRADMLISKNSTSLPIKLKAENVMQNGVESNAPETKVASTPASAHVESATTSTSGQDAAEASTSLDEDDSSSSSADDEDDQSSGSSKKLITTLSNTASDALEKLVVRLKPDASSRDSDSSAPEEESPSKGDSESSSGDNDEDADSENNLTTMANSDSDAAITTSTSSTSLMNNANGISHNEQEKNDKKKVNRPTRDQLKQAATTEAGPAVAMSEKLVIGSTGDKINGTQARAKELKFALDTYEIWRSSGEELIELISRKLLPLVMEHGYDVDPVTVTGLLQVFNGLRGLKPWAMKLLDASTKLSPGILLGTQSDFGDYDECLNVRVDDPAGLGLDVANQELDPQTGLPQSTLVGRYCLADVEFPKPPREWLPGDNSAAGGANGTQLGPIELLRPLYDFAESPSFRDTIWVETANFFHMLYVDPIRSAICLTNKIDPESFSQVFNKVFEEFRVTIKFNGRCVTKYDKREWTQFQRVSAWTLSIACCLVIVSTLLEILAIKLDKLPLIRDSIKCRNSINGFLENHKAVLTSFSLLRNTKRIFKRPQVKTINSYKKQNLCLQQQQQQAFINHRQQVKGATDSSVSQILEQSSSSLESSPQIDRRSSSQSATGSACQLLSYSGHGDASLLNKGAINKTSTQLAASTATSSPAADQLDLNCLHGIRVITMTWMIVNHTYMFGGFFVLWAHRRLIDIAEWPKSLSFQLVLNGWLTVETYFFLSAMIIILNVMPLMKARKFSYFAFILHRLIRLVPAYAGLVALNFLWPLISSGPVWLVKGNSFIEYPCENYLWTNFVFINNWIWPEKQCMVHTWFLSADFQLYLLAPLIVYLLYRRPVLGHSLNILIAICASILSGFVIYANKLLPATLINKLEFESIKVQLSYSYFATYQHMGPYCLGIFVGYMLHKRPNIRLPTHLSWILWLLLPPLSFTTLLLTYLWNGAYREASMINPSPLVSAFYIAIHRIIWTSLTAWLVFACVTNRAKMLANFLSHYYFVPISRLSFSIYLVHMPLIMYRALNMRHTKEWTDGNILWEACGNFVTSCLLGFFLNVTFESPLINLEQALFRRNDRAKGDNPSRLIQSLNGNQGSIAGSSPNDSPNMMPKHVDLHKDSPLGPAKDSQINAAEKKEHRFSSSSSSGQSNSSTGSDADDNSQLEKDQPSSSEPDAPKQLKNLGHNELFMPRLQGENPKLLRSKSTSRRSQIFPQNQLDDAHQNTNADEIYQLESENYHNVARRLAGFNERPAHYATLARTSRFSKQDMSMLLSNRAAYGPRTTHSESGSTYGTRRDIYPRNNHEHHQRSASSSFHPIKTNSGAHPPMMGDANSSGPGNLLAVWRDSSIDHHNYVNRRLGRYNTLSGARDLSNEHQHQSYDLAWKTNNEELMSSVESSEYDNYNPEYRSGVKVWDTPSSWNKLRQQLQQHRSIDDRPANQVHEERSSMGHYMIPRIEASTLRRIPASIRPDSARNSRIEEEPSSEDHEQNNHK